MMFHSSSSSKRRILRSIININNGGGFGGVSAIRRKRFNFQQQPLAQQIAKNYTVSRSSFSSRSYDDDQQTLKLTSPSITSSISTSNNKQSFSSTSKSTSTSTSSSSSVSQEEVNKFSSMADKWWEFENNPLISMNPIRMSFITQTLQSNNRLLSKPSSTITSSSYEPLHGLKVLDVGCGGGLLSESLARLGANVIAIDPSKEVANAAHLHSQLENKTSEYIDYKGGVSIEDLANEYYNNSQGSNNDDDDDGSGGHTTTPNNNELFDVICILEVIEHASDPKSLIQNAIKLLKQPSTTHPGGGILFISTINKTLKSYAMAIVGGEYILGKLPIGTHSWEQFKSPEDIRHLVLDCGLEQVVDVKGMVLHPPFFMDMKWKLDDTDFDINWIGAYSF